MFDGSEAWEDYHQQVLRVRDLNRWCDDEAASFLSLAHLMSRMKDLETPTSQTTPNANTQNTRGRGNGRYNGPRGSCWTCGGVGHHSRQCPTKIHLN